MEQTTIETWRNIPSYEGKCQISDLGRVNSLNYNNTKKEQILRTNADGDGYLYVVLCKNGIRKLRKVHQLVAESFLNHIPDRTLKTVIDHINNIKTDNRAENLQLITNRKNVSKDIKNASSKYTGVTWSKKNLKWVARIGINNKDLHLGYYISEIEASNAYQNRLKQL